MDMTAENLDQVLVTMRLDRTAAVLWPTVRAIAAELEATAALAAKADETERTLLRYTAEDLSERLHRAMRGES